MNDLKEKVKVLHGCDATHLETVPVHELFKGQTVWAGNVEVFALHGHPKAKKAYAWSYKDGDKTEYITILEIPPVDSAVAAVRVAIASGQVK